MSCNNKVGMHVEVNTPVPCTPPITFPFMWMSSHGCIYLRNRDLQDVIVGPRVQDNKIGVVTPACTDNDTAWRNRLAPGAFVKLVQN